MSQASDDRSTVENFAEEETWDSTTIKTETEPLSTYSAENENEGEEDPGYLSEWIKTPLINRRFVLKHPRVVLSFLRFLDEFNELADPDEVLMLPAIPQRIVQIVLSHSSLVNPPPEFLDEIRELRQRLDAHADLSELPQEEPPQLQ
jgi:hypothetical protein